MGGALDPDDFRAAMGRFATGVTVVTAQADGVLHGMTANAVASLSLDPLLVLVCVDREAGMHTFLPAAGRFAITVLAADQGAASTWFASPRRPHGTDQFDGVAWKPAPSSGAPVLLEGLAFLDCELRSTHDGGDHSIVVGEVTDIEVLRPDATPLVFYAGGYHGLGPRVEEP